VKYLCVFLCSYTRTHTHTRAHMARTDIAQQNPIDVTFTIQYGDELSQREKKPRLLCYLSSPVTNDPVELELPVDDAGKEMQVRISGYLGAGQKLPIDTQLVFYATCEKGNQFNVPCRVDAGFGTVMLKDLWAQPGYTNDVSLRLKSTGNVEKGRLRVRSGRKMVNISSRIQWDSTSIGGEIANAAGTNRVLPVEQQCLQYIKDLMQVEMSFPNTFPQTANVRIPIYYGDVGMMRPTPLPAAAYFMYKTPESNRLFWENNLKTVLARNGKVVSDVDTMSLTEQATVVGDMVCFVMQSFDYIADTVDCNRRFIKGLEGFIGRSIDRPYDPTQVAAGERFGDSGRDKAGDCEDVGSGIGQTFSSLNKADFKGHPQLQRLQEVASQYIAIMTLDSVTAAAVRAEDQKQKMGAHIKCNLFPKHYFNQCVEKGRHDTQRAIRTNRTAYAQKMVSAMIGNSVDKVADKVCFANLKPWAKDCPFIVCEGTGMFLTYGVDHDDIHNERAMVYKGMPSLAFCKKPIVHPPGAKSNFFKGSMVGFSNEWFDSGLANVAGMWIGYTGAESSEHGGGFQRGVHFEELINKSERVSIVMHPEFTDRQMEYMRRATAIRVPPLDYILTKEGMAKQSKTEPTIDSLVQFTKSMNRKRVVEQDPAPVYFQTHQLTESIVNAIKNDIERNSYITDMSYVCEHITDWHHQYRVGIHANVR